MLVKILTGLALAAVALFAILEAPFLWVAPVAAVVFLIAQDEFIRLPGRQVKRVERLVAALAGAGVLAAAALMPLEVVGGTVAGYGFVFQGIATAFALGVVAILLAVLFSPHPIEQAGGRASQAIAGLAYVGLLSAIALLILRDEHHQTGRYVVLLAGVVTWGNDTMAYFGGKTFGRHKMYPAISPNKTWEGSVSGMLGSVGGALIIGAWLLPAIGPASLVGFALVGGALGQVGDLAESLFKRTWGVKDSGDLLPGHGGFLDRIDAFLFVAPLAWFWFYWLFPFAG
jgi:phosphatidate cytidylyltransferase